MKSRIKNFWKYLAAAVLGVLGFSSCGEEIEPEGMYGSPYASFKALGTVKDEAGKPIEGIKVSVNKDWSQWGEGIITDNIFTDAKGEYILDQRIWPAEPVVTIFFEDVDGAANGGEFASAEAKPDIKSTQEITEDRWRKAVIEAKADIVLKKK